MFKNIKLKLLKISDIIQKIMSFVYRLIILNILIFLIMIYNNKNIFFINITF